MLPESRACVSPHDTLPPRNQMPHQGWSVALPNTSTLLSWRSGRQASSSTGRLGERRHGDRDRSHGLPGEREDACSEVPVPQATSIPLPAPTGPQGFPRPSSPCHPNLPGQLPTCIPAAAPARSLPHLQWHQANPASPLPGSHPATGPLRLPFEGPSSTLPVPCKGACDPIQTSQRPLSSCTSMRHFSFKKPSKSLTWRCTLLKAKAVWELGWELPEGRSAGEMTARVRQQVGAEPGRPHAPRSILQSQRWVGSRNRGQGGGWEKSGEDSRRTRAESLGIQQGRAASSWSVHKAKMPRGPAIPRAARLWLPLSGLGGAWCPGLTPPAGPALGRRTQGPSPSSARPCSRDSRRPRAAEIPALPMDDYRVSG